MTTINNLSEVTSVSSGDQVPIYASGQGQARKASMSQVATFIASTAAVVPIPLDSLTVAELNADYPAAQYPYHIAYCTNGNAGAACVAVSNGTDWKLIALGATINP